MKGDWSSGCFVRPTVFTITFDASEPPNITLVTVQYTVIQPSGLQPVFMHLWTPSTQMPITQGIQAIQDAVNDIIAYEGLAVG